MMPECIPEASVKTKMTASRAFFLVLLVVPRQQPQSRARGQFQQAQEQKRNQGVSDEVQSGIHAFFLPGVHRDAHSPPRSWSC